MRKRAVWVRNESELLLGAAVLLGLACAPAAKGDDDGSAGGSQATGGASASAGVASGGTGLASGAAPAGGSGGGLTCSTGLLCNGACFDPFTDPNHCGSCGRACASSERCAGGTCTPSTGGTSGAGGAAGSGAVTGGSGGAGANGGTPGSGGAGGRGGAGGASGGKGGAPSGGSGGGTVTACGGKSVTVNPNPFGCELAWGANGNASNRPTYLDFITTWVGYEANGGLNGACDGCGLARTLQTANALAVYYAYFVGYQARVAGYGDCNTDSDGQNLCTHGASWIKSNRQRLVDMYANYARLTNMASPNKGVVWLLEGDFIQYTYAEQTSPLTMAELGTLTSDIVCAIKSNQPNAAVAINHSTWIRNPQMSSYFNAMPLSLIDLVWTTGMGDVAGGSFNDGDARNRSDGTYAYLRTLTGKKIVVDTSFGVTRMDDSWTAIPVATLNQRIADGVVAVNVTTAGTSTLSDATYQSRIGALGPQLSSACQ
jgi:hypothetical protein